jgi:hypothetical protein
MANKPSGARERVKAFVARNGFVSVERIRRALKNPPVPSATIRTILKELGAPAEAEATTTPAKAAKPAKVRVRSLTDFRAEHDYAAKIAVAIKAHLSDGYLTEQEFKLVAGVPNHEWRRFADLPEFNENKFRRRDVTYWASPKVIRQMKEIVGAI